MSSDERDPRRQTRKVTTRFQETIRHLRQGGGKDKPQLRIFGISPEVLNGNTRIFDHFERQSEIAWRS
ncbi:hypothetical protein DUT91_02965 [Phyllobacterium salinisoli]|uniref:Uncharacterized protein n=1 Tax=Phyllobacterium salinisoli TaxID=1899321 RepID=A0A368KAY2_9HYPH|nr:hypothetical protein DUT91_02965 [Phyllobacterium salinisoli]